MMPDFDQEKFVGHWYEVERDYLNLYTLFTDCTTQEFQMTEDGNVDLYFRGDYPFFGYHGVGG